MILIGKRKTLKKILDNLEKVREMSENGHTKDKIAKHFGVSRQTFYEYEKLEPSIARAVESGRSVVVEELKSAMLKRAVGFQYEEKKVTTQQIEYENGGVIVPAKLIRTEVTTKTALPEVGAGLLLLQHWDTDKNGKTKWSKDPAALEIKEKELELKQQRLENETW